jgi:hypothetical protein
MKMTQSTKPTPNPDDLLADFTDRVLDGKTAVIAPSTGDELRGLEETVMRLHQALPKGALDERVVKRMQADFKSRARKAGPAARPGWQSRQSRQRLALAFAVIAVLAAIFLLTPFLTGGNGEVQGTAGFQPQGAFLLLAAGGAIALLIWLGRRK